MEIPDEIKIKTMQLAAKGVFIEWGTRGMWFNDSGVEDYEPYWNWYDNRYRPVANHPKWEVEHTGELRIPVSGEYYISWDTGFASKLLNHTMTEPHWIVRKVEDEQPYKPCSRCGQEVAVDSDPYLGVVVCASCTAKVKPELPAYHIWTSGDPVPDELPEGCEFWEGFGWVLEYSLEWTGLLRRWPVKEADYE